VSRERASGSRGPGRVQRRGGAGVQGESGARAGVESAHGRVGRELRVRGKFGGVAGQELGVRGELGARVGVESREPG
jgi:hypothetical protein